MLCVLTAFPLLYSQSSTLSSMDRYIKQAIVDKNELVASCALVSGLHLYNVSAKLCCPAARPLRMRSMRAYSARLLASRSTRMLCVDG